MQTSGRAGMLERIHRVDLAAFAWCHRARAEAAVFRVARHVSRSADGWLYALLPLLYLLSGDPGGFALVELAAAAFLGERAAYLVMKNTCRRRRPPEVLPGFRSLVVASDRFSFPSGHTSGAFLFAGLCAAEFGGWAALMLYPWAVCVAASRVFLGVHFPSDTVAGAALGTGLLLVARAALGA